MSFRFEVWHWSWSWEKVNFILAFVIQSPWGIHIMILHLNFCLCETNTGHPRGPTSGFLAPRGGRCSPQMRLAGPMSPFSSLHVRTTLVVTEWRRDHTTCPQAQDRPEHCHHTQKYSTPFSKICVKPGWTMIPLLHGFIQRLSFPYIFCIVHLLSIFLLWRIPCLSGCLGRTHILKNELYSLSCRWILGWPFLIVGTRHSRVWSCCVLLSACSSEEPASRSSGWGRRRVWQKMDVKDSGICGTL